MADFHFLVDKMHSKLQGWKAKLLSQAARSTLISSTLQSMPLYSFSCFKVPESICNKMDAISRAFSWRHYPNIRKMHLLSQDKICRSRWEEGLGLKNFSMMNQSMLAKQFWRINQNPQPLISKIFKAKYFPHSIIHDCIPKPHHSWFWRGIITQKNSNFRKEGGLQVRVLLFLSLTRIGFPDSHKFQNNTT